MQVVQGVVLWQLRAGRVCACLCLASPLPVSQLQPNMPGAPDPVTWPAGWPPFPRAVLSSSLPTPCAVEDARPFTLDPVAWPPEQLAQFVANLTEAGRHWVPVANPGEVCLSAALGTKRDC